MGDSFPPWKWMVWPFEILHLPGEANDLWDYSICKTEDFYNINCLACRILLAISIHIYSIRSERAKQGVVCSRATSRNQASCRYPSIRANIFPRYHDAGRDTRTTESRLDWYL